MVDADGVESINDMFHENTMLQTDNNNLRQRIKAMQQTVEGLTAKNAQLLVDQDLCNMANVDGDDGLEVRGLIEGYVKEIEELRYLFSRRSTQVAQSRWYLTPGQHVYSHHKNYSKAP